MKKKYSYPFGITFLVAVSILSTSFIPIATESEIYWPEPGSYELLVKGEKELNIQGHISYDQNLDAEEQGQLPSTYHLKLRQENKLIEHSFDLFIGDELNNSGLEEGIYHISEDIQGIFKEFEGVFGVADIVEFGELPYFTEKGKITISHVNGETLAGQLQLTMSNYLGEEIKVEGKFIVPTDL